MPDVKEFMNPKSTLTPGIAGAIAMLAANTLWVTFGLPQAWTALAVSTLFALLVSTGLAAPLWQRGIYLILNSLVIFSVGIGSNALGGHATEPSTPQRSSSGHYEPLAISSAFAQQPPSTWSADEVKRRQDEVKQKELELRRREEELSRKERELKGGAAPSPPGSASEGASRKFFEQWKF